MIPLLNSYKAFLFDLNGTMVDDMRHHVLAWYDILNNTLEAGLSYEEVKAQMYGKNEELFVRVFGNDRYTAAEVEEHSMEKERRYQQSYLPELRLINGLPELLDQAHKQGIKMAIGSAAIPFNINFVIDNLNIRHYFSTIVSAKDVAFSKPDPTTYLQCAENLGVAIKDCLVFEDAPKGVEAAQNAGMDCIVLTTLHDAHEFAQYTNVVKIVSDYTSFL